MLRLVTPLALVALAAACQPGTRTPSSPIVGVRLIAAYRTAVACVDSVAGLAGFDQTTVATTTRGSRTWTLTVRRPALREEGAEAHVIRIEYGVIPGRDSVRLVRATAETYRYASNDARASKPLAPAAAQRAITKLAVPGMPARSAIRRISHACGLLRIEEPSPARPFRHRSIGG